MKKSDANNDDKSVDKAMDNKIAAVRDLIFGENIAQYDQDFEKVYNQIQSLENRTDENISNLKKELEKKIDDLRTSMEASLEKMKNEFNKRLDELDDDKADRRKLGDALEKVALMLKS